MGLFNRSVRRFTKAESFRAFIEGIRGLHGYDGEADKDEPDEDLLNLHLSNAENFFRDCVETYPNDLLPRYYFGIVLSTRGQLEQARILRSELADGQSKPLNVDPDRLLLQAAKHFEKITEQVGRRRNGRDLLVFAQYNQAQALAKTQPIPHPGHLKTPYAMAEIIKPRAEKPNDDQMHWNAALRILQNIDPRLVMTKVSFQQRIAARLRNLRGLFGSKNLIDVRLSPHRRNATEVSAGVAIPLKERQGEDRAFEIQVRVLEYAIHLRKAVHGGRKLTLEDLPQDQEKEKEHARLVAGTSGIAGAEATVRDFVARIQEDTIPSEAQKDIVADYWNKLAFIAWERATLVPQQVDTDWLQRARKYIDIARAGRDNWTPGQLNLARILAAERKKAEALNTLVKVLGTKKVATVSPPISADPQPDAVVSIPNAVEGTRDATESDVKWYKQLLEDSARKLAESSAPDLKRLAYYDFHRSKRAERFARARKHSRKP